MTIYFINYKYNIILIIKIMSIKPRKRDLDEKQTLIIAKNLRIVRMIHNLTLSDVGKIIGVSGQQVQKYETGGTPIRVSLLIKFAKHFNVPVAMFFDEITMNTFFNYIKND